MDRFIATKSSINNNTLGNKELISKKEIRSTSFLRSKNERNQTRNITESWTCEQCTFINENQDKICQMCENERSQTKNSIPSSADRTGFEYESDSKEPVIGRNSSSSEIKENIANTIFQSVDPILLKQPVVKDALSSSMQIQKGRSFPVSIIRRSSEVPTVRSAPTKPMNLVDLCNIEEMSDENDDQEDEIVDTEDSTSYWKPKIGKQKEEAEEGNEEDVYDYSEDGTYSEDSTIGSSDEEEEDDEGSEDSDADLESVNSDILVDTPRKSKEKKIINLEDDDIDEFEDETSSDLSVSAFFSTDTLIHSEKDKKSSKKDLSNFLSNRTKEVKPTFSEISSHFWSVKYLSRKEICAINFDDFTLDKGATNPNTAQSLLQKHKTKRLPTVNDIYEKRREKRAGNSSNRQRSAMIRRLNENGALTAEGEKVKRRKTKKEKPTKSRKRKTGIEAILDGAETTNGKRKGKKRKRSARKKSAGSNSHGDGWITTSRGAASGGRYRPTSATSSKVKAEK